MKGVIGSRLSEQDMKVVKSAIRRLEKTLLREDVLDPWTKPEDIKDYLRLKLAHYEHELFCVIWLDNRNRFIAFEEIHRGSHNGCQVMPREVVKSALAHNSSSCCLAHNHPSGAIIASMADRQITDRLKDALSLIDVRLLDHFIVGSEDILSFAEQGYL